MRSGSRRIHVHVHAFRGGTRRLLLWSVCALLPLTMLGALPLSSAAASSGNGDDSVAYLAQVSAAACPTPSVKITPSTIEAGQPISATATGTGWEPGGQINAALLGHTANNVATVGQDGTWSYQLNSSQSIPAQYAGTYTGTFSEQTSDCGTLTANATVTVVAPSGNPTPTPTPTTTPTTTFTVSGMVFVDANGNGSRDSGEAGFTGATVTLNGQSTTTNSTGAYSFSNIAAGSYTETLTIPSGYHATTTNPVSLGVDANTTHNFGIAQNSQPTQPGNNPTTQSVFPCNGSVGAACSNVPFPLGPPDPNGQNANSFAPLTQAIANCTGQMAPADWTAYQNDVKSLQQAILALDSAGGSAPTIKSLVDTIPFGSCLPGKVNAFSASQASSLQSCLGNHDCRHLLSEQLGDMLSFFKTWAASDQRGGGAKNAINTAAYQTWLWGPQPDSAPGLEYYQGAKAGVSDSSPIADWRVVEYFDKSRMEITDPTGDANSIWYVTNGLIAKELITGQMQVGNDTFVQKSPAQINIAGDLNDPNGPTYASFNKVLGYGAIPTGWKITQTIDRSGHVSADPSLASYNVTAMDVGALTHHTVASVFWNFMTSVSGKAYGNSFYATGYPLTEPYWTTVKVGGVSHQVLVQVFERRVLTYTPSNPAGWQVESGNVGQHYYLWRYGQMPQVP